MEIKQCSNFIFEVETPKQNNKNFFNNSTDFSTDIMQHEINDFEQDFIQLKLQVFQFSLPDDENEISIQYAPKLVHSKKSKDKLNEIPFMQL